jgi:hypothetical protein
MSNERYKKIGNLDGLGKAAAGLIDDYIEASDLLTPRQLAEMEHRIWKALPAAKRREWRRSYFFREVFGGGIRCFQVRAALYAMGDRIGPIWDRMEPDYPERMSLSTALGLAREAKSMHLSDPRQYPKFSDALDTALADYDARPLAVTYKDGTVVRRRAPLGMPSRKEATRAAAAPPSSRPPPATRNGNGNDSKRFYGQVRSLASAYIAGYLEDADEEVAEQVYADFEFELKVLLHMLQSRVCDAKRRLKRERNLSDRTRQSHLRDDFVELGMDPPKPLLKPNIKKIRSQYRALARAYHPDKQPAGAPDLSAKFQSATEAYNRIIAYYRDKGIT